MDLSLISKYLSIDTAIVVLIAVLIVYVTHLVLSPALVSEIEDKIKKYPPHFVSYKPLDAKATVMLRMLEEEIDTYYDYSSTIKVTGCPVRSQGTAKASFVLTDPNLPDNPIIYASEQFSKFTGYSKDEIEGRNCRFLQGEKTDPEDVKEIRSAINSKREASLQLLNYKKGLHFINFVYY